MTRSDLIKSSTALTLCLAASLPVGQAVAQTASPPAQTGMPGNPAVAPADAGYVAPRTFGEWSSSIKLGAQGEAGIVGNTRDPDSGRNFGQLITDKANRPILNQLLITASRDVDPKATSVDIGFKLQAMYGSDSRIYHTLGIMDQLIHDRNQIALIEANVAARIPQLFANGLDVKVGLYPTPLGVELIDPKGNAFYSHSYLFNYGVPYKHVGFLSTAHTSDLLDLYFGVDTGTNTGFAYGAGDNNNRPGGIAGFGLNFAGGALTVLALTHIGPEDSKHLAPFANSALRYFNDVVVTWKATDKLTLTAEGNFVRDDGYHAQAYGGAAYVGYALTDTVTLNGRAEIFRDENNFFVSNPIGNQGFANFQRGTFANVITAKGPTTYSELTAGFTYKPTWTPQWLSTAMVRPEVRWDQSLGSTRPFGSGRDKGVITLAADVILGF